MAKTIVVTGAGSGIGKAIAKQLADTGHSLLLMGRHLEPLEQTRLEMTAPDQHQCFSCDITRPAQIRDALQRSGTESLYGLVANAGLGIQNQYGESDGWNEIIETNLTGTYNTINECLSYIRQDSTEFRKILMLSSALAFHGVPGFSAYSAAKAGMLGMMRSLAVELAPERILVNAVCPALTDTPMAQGIFHNMGQALGISEEAAYQATMSQVPLGKMSTPDEVAGLVGFLMSQAETSITGQAVHMNNGLIMN